MYAVVHTGGKQYKMAEGDVFRVEKLPGEVGDTVDFDQVLLLSDGENLTIGQPRVENARVRGHIVEQDRAKKILVFKYKRRKRFRRKQGHRQYYTAVKIDKISPDGEAGLDLAQKETPAETPPIAEPTPASEGIQSTEDIQAKEE